MIPDDARALLTRLIRQIAPEVDVETIDPDAPIQEAMDLDSMDFLRLITSLSEEAGIDVPERDYPHLQTWRAAVTYVAASG